MLGFVYLYWSAHGFSKYKCRCFVFFVVCMQIHDVLYLKKLQLILTSMACLK